MHKALQLTLTVERVFVHLLEFACTYIVELRIEVLEL